MAKIKGAYTIQGYVLPTQGDAVRSCLIEVRRYMEALGISDYDFHQDPIAKSLNDGESHLATAVVHFEISCTPKTISDRARKAGLDLSLLQIPAQASQTRAQA